MIKVKGISLTVYPWTHRSGKTHWRFAWYSPDGKRRYTTKANQKQALISARDKAREINNQSYKLSELPQDTLRLVRDFLELSPTQDDLSLLRKWKSQKTSILQEVVEEYLEAKRSAGISEIYLMRLSQTLRKLVEELPEKTLQRVNLSTLEEWFLENYGEKAAKTRNNIRGTLVSFWKWARMRDLISDAITVPERLPTAKVKRKPPPTLPPEQGADLLKHCPPEYLPWLIMCGWGACRTEEVCPHPKSTKLPLAWEDFHWQKGVVIVRPETSKMGEKRIVPLNPVIESWLKDHAGRGPIVTVPPPSYSGGERSITSQLGKLIGGWKRNALRNSYISYRGAQIGLAKTAMEAGNSESECRRSYNDAVLELDAKKWFSLLRNP